MTSLSSLAVTYGILEARDFKGSIDVGRFQKKYLNRRCLRL